VLLVSVAVVVACVLVLVGRLLNDRRLGGQRCTTGPNRRLLQLPIS
jgi:hypothetical protein